MATDSSRVGWDWRCTWRTHHSFHQIQRCDEMDFGKARRESSPPFVGGTENGPSEHEAGTDRSVPSVSIARDREGRPEKRRICAPDPEKIRRPGRSSRSQGWMEPWPEIGCSDSGDHWTANGYALPVERQQIQSWEELVAPVKGEGPRKNPLRF